VDPPQRDLDVAPVEGALPGQGVVVGGVDEGAIDVEEDGCIGRSGHGPNLAPVPAPNRSRGLREVGARSIIYNLMVVDTLTDSEVDRLFHALADRTRRDIVRRSLLAEHSVSELARSYPMSVTAVQKHVAVLEEAGLVAKRRHGREQRVVGRPAALRRAQELLDAYEQLWRERVDRMTDVLETDERGDE
jgi:DNA-binding transcriptional ArsR family regulator